MLIERLVSLLTSCQDNQMTQLTVCKAFECMAVTSTACAVVFRLTRQLHESPSLAATPLEEGTKMKT